MLKFIITVFRDFLLYTERPEAGISGNSTSTKYESESYETAKRLANSLMIKYNSPLMFTDNMILDALISSVDKHNPYVTRTGTDVDDVGNVYLYAVTFEVSYDNQQKATYKEVNDFLNELLHTGDKKINFTAIDRDGNICHDVSSYDSVDCVAPISTPDAEDTLGICVNHFKVGKVNKI